MRPSISLAFAATLLAPSLAPADVPVPASPCATNPLHCEQAPLHFTRADTQPTSFPLDTGWTPQNSPLAVDIAARVDASSRVSVDGELITTWPAGLTLDAPGATMGGAFGFDWRADVTAKGSIQINVNGQPYSWTGDIPFTPQFDFSGKADTTFDAWSWAPGAMLQSTIPPQRLATVDIAGLAGGTIPGIAGGFELDVSATLRANYATRRIVLATADGKMVDGGAIEQAGAKSSVRLPGGPNIELDVHPEGTIRYGGEVHLIPSFHVTILQQSWSIPMMDIALQIPLTSTDWVFDPVRVHVPLPMLDCPVEIDFGEVQLGQSSTKPLSLDNKGEAALEATITVTNTDLRMDAMKVDVDPGKSRPAMLTFTPSTTGNFAARLVVTANDPAVPTREIAITGYVPEPSGVDLGEPDAAPTSPDNSKSSGCALDTGRREQSPTGLLALIGLAALLVPLRRYSKDTRRGAMLLRPRRQ